MVDDYWGEAAKTFTYVSNLTPRRKLLEQDPETIMEAQARSDWAQLDLAMKDELQSFDKLKVYELAELPAGKNLIPCKWISQGKYNVDNTLKKYKGRRVACGYF